VLDFYGACEQWRERSKEIEKAVDSEKSARKAAPNAARDAKKDADKSTTDSRQVHDAYCKQPEGDSPTPDDPKKDAHQSSAHGDEKAGADMSARTLPDLNPYIQNVIMVDGLDEVPNHRRPGGDCAGQPTAQGQTTSTSGTEAGNGSSKAKAAAGDEAEAVDFRVSLQHLEDLQLAILTHLTAELPSVAIGTLRHGRDGWKDAASIVVSSTPVLYLDVRRRPPARDAKRLDDKEDNESLAARILYEAKLYRDAEWTVIRRNGRLDVLDVSRMAFWHMKWKEAMSLAQGGRDVKATVQLHEAIRLAKEENQPQKQPKVCSQALAFLSQPSQLALSAIPQ
jgi:hypothetical protein